jgi:hypothetical protein
MFEQSSGSLIHEPQVVLSALCIIPFGHVSHFMISFSQIPQHSPFSTCTKSAGQAEH